MEQTEVTRKALHTRHIEMRGWERSDGLFEVEGRLLDRKPFDFMPRTRSRGVPAGEPVHDLGVRIVYDLQMKVHAIETFTNAAPYAAVCAEGGRALQSVVGLHMTSGWNKEVRNRLSGARSCTHLMELLTPMATTAFQSLSHLDGSVRPERVDASGRPVKIDSCHAYGASQEVVMRHWPEYYRPVARN